VSDGEDDAPEVKSPAEQVVEHAFELFVYAPIGLLFEGSSLLPELIAKGKQQVGTARVMGKFFLEQVQKQAGETASRLQDQTAGVLDFLSDSVGPLASGEPPAAPPEPEPEPEPEPPDPAPTAKTVDGARADDDADAVSAASLAIPDYDGLSASQVVNRLASLSPSELANVQRYEAAHRGRKTILSKVAQLQGR
jgi:hypothetical protein